MKTALRLTLILALLVALLRFTTTEPGAVHNPLSAVPLFAAFQACDVTVSTIGALQSAVSTGGAQTICVTAGNYTPSGGTLSISNGGTVGTPLTIRAASSTVTPWDLATGSRARILGEIAISDDNVRLVGLEVNDGGDNSDMVLVQGADNVGLTGMLLKNAQDLILFNDATNGFIVDSVMDNTGLYSVGSDTIGVRLKPDSSDILIDGNEIINVTDGVHSNESSNFVSNITVTNNFMFAQQTDCNGNLVASGACSVSENFLDAKIGDNWTVRNNIATGIKETDETITGTGSRGFMFGIHNSAAPSEDFILERNVGYDIGHIASLSTNLSRRITIRNNIFHDYNEYTASHNGGANTGRGIQLAGAQRVEIYNNTFSDVFADGVDRVLTITNNNVNLDFRNNAILDDAQVNGGLGGTDAACFNYWTDGAQINGGTGCTVGDDVVNTTLPAADFCLTSFPLTNPTIVCLPNIYPTIGWPGIDGGEATVGSRTGIGIDDTVGMSDDKTGANRVSPPDFGALEAGQSGTPTPGAGGPTNTATAVGTSTSTATTTPTPTVQVFACGVNHTINHALAIEEADAEEEAAGDVLAFSGDIEHAFQQGQDQSLTIQTYTSQLPQGTTIVSAHMQFVADSSDAPATSWTFYAENIDDSPYIDSTSPIDPFQISARTLTAASVNFQPEAWTAGLAYSTLDGTNTVAADLSPIVQEIVNRPLWAAGQKISIITIGDLGFNQRRAAVSYDKNPGQSAILSVTFNTPCVVASTPTATSTPDPGPIVAPNNETVECSDGAYENRLLPNTIANAANWSLGNDQQFWAIVRFPVNTDHMDFIDYAYLDLTASADSPADDDFELTISGYQIDSAPAIAGGAAANISPLHQTDVVEYITGLPPILNGAVYSSPNLRRVFQEIVNRGGYVAGNPISLILEAKGGVRDFVGCGGGAGLVPTLRIGYTDAAPTALPPNTAVPLPTNVPTAVFAATPVPTATTIADCFDVGSGVIVCL